MRKPDLLDCRILSLVYDRVDWETRLWMTEDFLDKINQKPATLLYHIRKLVSEDYLVEVRSYPKAWRAGDRGRYDDAEKTISFALKYLVRKDGRV